MSLDVATPRMRRQLRLLAVLGGFVVFIVAVAFIAAFRNTDTVTESSTVTRLDTQDLRDGAFRRARVTADVVLAGEEYRVVDMWVVRTGGRVHALWSRSTHLGCRVAPRRGTNAAPAGAVFEDPCGGSLFAIDGRCLSGPCPRDLDEFAVVERNGIAYADLTHVVRGKPRAA